MDRKTEVRLIAAVLTLLGVAVFPLRSGGVRADEPVDLASFPRALGEWTGREVELPEDLPPLAPSQERLLRAYEAPGQPPVWILMDYHRVQRAGATVHSPQICYPAAGWDVISPEHLGRDSCGRITVQRKMRQLEVLYWYQSRWGRSARETMMKLRILRSALARRPADVALIRFSTAIVDGDTTAARARLDRVADLAAEPVDRVLPFARRAP